MKTRTQNRRERKAKQTSGSVKQRYRVSTSSPWRRWGWILALLVVAAIVVVVVLLVQSQSGDIAGMVTYSNLSRNHKETPMTYAQIPPVGGDHSASWQTCGIYSSPVPNEHAVHSLEHGAVWITYQPTLVVHSLNTHYFDSEGKLLGAVRRLMPTTTTPNKRMLVRIPISGGCFHCCHHLLPGFKSPSFQGQ